MLKWTEPRLIKLSERKAKGADCEPTGNSASQACWDGTAAIEECDVGNGL